MHPRRKAHAVSSLSHKGATTPIRRTMLGCGGTRASCASSSAKRDDAIMHPSVSLPWHPTTLPRPDRHQVYDGRARHAVELIHVRSVHYGHAEEQVSAPGFLGLAALAVCRARWHGACLRLSRAGHGRVAPRQTRQWKSTPRRTPIGVDTKERRGVRGKPICWVVHWRRSHQGGRPHPLCRSLHLRTRAPQAHQSPRPTSCWRCRRRSPLPSGIKAPVRQARPRQRRAAVLSKTGTSAVAEDESSTRPCAVGGCLDRITVPRHRDAVQTPTAHRPTPVTKAQAQRTASARATSESWSTGK